MATQVNKIYVDAIRSTKPKVLSFIKVETLFNDLEEELRLKLVNGQHSFDRKIKEKELNRPGLALSGFVEVFTYWRVQIIGNTEIGYMKTLSDSDRKTAIQRILKFEMPCVVVTQNNELPKEFIEIADKNGISVFSTPENTTSVHRHMGEYLDTKFAPRVVVHGTLVDIFSVGVLLVGPAAIGKSELSLDLIERGHQLVADDAVEITKIGAANVRGAPKGNIGHHMEIRGIGIVDVFKMFGVRGIRGSKRINVVVRLEKYDPQKIYERTGLDERVTKIMGVDVPFVEIPMIEGKNITIVAEAVALNHKLKQIGINPAVLFEENLKKRMLEPDKPEEEIEIETEDF